MTKKSTKKIVKRKLPEMDIVQKAQAPARRSIQPAAAPGPSMAELRRKFLGEDAVDAESDKAVPDEQDVEVVKVKTKRMPSDPVDDPGPRTVIVSKKKGIFGVQG